MSDYDDADKVFEPEKNSEKMSFFKIPKTTLFYFETPTQMKIKKNIFSSKISIWVLKQIALMSEILFSMLKIH